MKANNNNIPRCCGDCEKLMVSSNATRTAYQCGMTRQCFTAKGNEWMWLKRSPRCPLSATEGNVQ